MKRPQRQFTPGNGSVCGSGLYNLGRKTSNFLQNGHTSWPLYSPSAGRSSRSGRSAFPKPLQPSRSSRLTLSRSSRLGQKLARDINTEMFTKVVPRRAVNFSIGAFCTEFWRERFCDNDVFWVRHSRSADRLHQPMDPIGRSEPIGQKKSPLLAGGSD